MWLLWVLAKLIMVILEDLVGLSLFAVFVFVSIKAYLFLTNQKDKAAILPEKQPPRLPWLKVQWSEQDFHRLKTAAAQFRPPASKTANILLLGAVGSGKSSFVSSVDSLFEGRVSRRAQYGQAVGSMTRKLRKYKFWQPAKDDDGDSSGNSAVSYSKELGFCLWDTMGWDPDSYKSQELSFLLNGNLADRFDLTALNNNITGIFNQQGFKTAPMFEDKVHCLVFMVPADSATDGAYLQRLNQLRKFAIDKELPVLVFLTKIDDYDAEVRDDITKTFHSVRVWNLVEEIASKAGIPRNSIFPLKNFHSEPEPSSNTGILILRALHEALNAAKDFHRDLILDSEGTSKEKVEADEDWSPLKCEVKKRSQGGQVFDEGIKGWIKTDSIG